MNGVFRTQPNIYDGAFLRKYLASQKVSPNVGKHAPEATPNTNTFHAVLIQQNK